MASLETSPVEQREWFIRDHRVGLYPMAELCARYDVSRRPARFSAFMTGPLGWRRVRGWEDFVPTPLT